MLLRTWSSTSSLPTTAWPLPRTFSRFTCAQLVTESMQRQIHTYPNIEVSQSAMLIPYFFQTSDAFLNEEFRDAHPSLHMRLKMLPGSRIAESISTPLESWGISIWYDKHTRTPGPLDRLSPLAGRSWIAGSRRLLRWYTTMFRLVIPIFSQKDH